MQNKGVIKLLALLLALFTVYQLSFTFVTRHVESKAKAYAESPKTVALAEEMANGDQNALEYYLDSIKTAKETYYLDSVGTITVYMWQDYRKCKEQELNLGLDLKGGMNVMMEVSVPDIIYALAGNSIVILKIRHEEALAEKIFLLLLERAVTVFVELHHLPDFCRYFRIVQF